MTSSHDMTRLAITMTETVQLLNPSLHRLLHRNVPGGVLRVLHPGVPLQGYFRRMVYGSRQGSNSAKARFKKVVAGEEYILNCPFCNDTRGRLSVNHSFGIPDEEEPDDRRLWLANCYNEHCLDSQEKRQQFYNMVYTTPAGRVRSALRRPLNQVVVIKDIREPGHIIRLDELAQTQPEHKALDYMRGREFDPVWLGQKWGVGYCTDSRFALARDRIYIPIVMNAKLVGWQMRYIGEWQKGLPPKYWSCPGQQRSKILYNFDRAKHYHTVVLVEGPMDAWRVGGPGIAVIGKTLGMEALVKLVATCGDGACVIMLDPKQDEAAAKKGRPHHIEAAYQQLRGKFRDGVAKVYLPETLDPGSADHDYLLDFAKSEGEAQGVKVSFKKVR